MGGGWHGDHAALARVQEEGSPKLPSSPLPPIRPACQLVPGPTPNPQAGHQNRDTLAWKVTQVDTDVTPRQDVTC